MAKNHFPHVYQPLDVRTMHLKNRIQYSPIVSNHAGYESGEVTDKLFEFLRGQAATGCALMTIGSTPIDFAEGRDFFGCLSATRDADIPGLSTVAREVHRMHCNISAELTHAGQWAEHCLATTTGARAFAPSVIEGMHDPSRYIEVGRREMDQVIEAHVDCVKRVKAAGFDQAMIHMAHGNLLSGFISTFWNHRTDEYGGTPQNRWRFPLEVLEACREAAGDMPLEIRFQGNEWLDGGTGIEERCEFLKEAQKYIDYVVVSGGTLFFAGPGAWARNMPGYYVKSGINLDAAAAFKEACPDLVISVCGGITTLEECEDIIASGKADMVAMAKALMSDPQYVVKGEQGREEDIAPCLRCLYCHRNLQYTAHLEGCVNNPTLGWEFRGTQLAPTVRDPKVMIVGGGPGGMMAAKTLKERGFSDVTIYDDHDVLGGRLPEASALSFKDGFRRYYDYIVRQTEKNGTKIVLNTKVDAELVRAEAPEVLIVACGGKVIHPPIEGIEKALDVDLVDREEVEVGKKVVVCGAGASGSECALELAMKGHEVTLIDMVPVQDFFKDLVNFNADMLDENLTEYKVDRQGGMKVKKFTDDGVLAVDADGNEVLFEADSCVNAFGVAPDKAFIETLTDEVAEAYVIGDADQTGVIGSATNRAYWICRDIK